MEDQEGFGDQQLKVIGNIVGKRASFSSNNSSNAPSAQGINVSKAHSDNDKVDKVRGLRSFNRFVEKMKSDYRDKVSEVQSHIEGTKNDRSAPRGAFGYEHQQQTAANANKESSKLLSRSGKSAKDNTSRSFDDVPSFFGVNDKSQKSDNISREAPLASFTASKPANHDSKANKSADITMNNKNLQNLSFDGVHGGFDDSFGANKPMDLEVQDANQECPQNILDDSFGFAKATANDSPDGVFADPAFPETETGFILKDVDAVGGDLIFTGTQHADGHQKPSSGHGNQYFQQLSPQITQSSGPAFGYVSKASRNSYQPR